MVTQKQPVVFQCSACGECCSSVTIPVEKAKTATLLEKDWVRQRLAETGLSIEPIDATHDRLPMTPEGYCVFLGEDMHCMIHTRESPDLKPLECQRFPFAGLKTPSGQVLYDASASCKTIANELLTAFTDIIPAPGNEPELHEEGFPQRVKVRGFQTIDEAGYSAYQTAITAVMSDESLSPELALKRVVQIIRALPGKPHALAESFAFRPFWEPLVLLAFLRRPYGILNQQALLTGGLYGDSKIFGPQPIDLKELNTVRWDSPTLDRLVKGYLHNLLRRKVLLSFGHSLEGLALLTIHALFIVRWYARVLALVQNRDEVTFEDLSMAVRLTERYYTGHQPAFPEFFRVFPAAGFYLFLITR